MKFTKVTLTKTENGFIINHINDPYGVVQVDYVAKNINEISIILKKIFAKETKDGHRKM